MKQGTGHSIKKNIANFFGSFGYLLCFLQWFWAIILYFSVIQSAALFISPNITRQVEQPHSLTFALPGLSEMIIAAIIVAIMVAVTIYALIKIPLGIVKTGNKIVHRTAETMTPVVIKAQHKKDTKKIHTKITSKLTLVIKLLLIIIPIALAAASGLLEKQSLDYSIVMVIGWALACLSVAAFAIQYTIAGLFHVKMSDLR
jgi:hypothetical protein